MLRGQCSNPAGAENPHVRQNRPEMGHPEPGHPDCFESTSTSSLKSFSNPNFILDTTPANVLRCQFLRAPFERWKDPSRGSDRGSRSSDGKPSRHLQLLP